MKRIEKLEGRIAARQRIYLQNQQQELWQEYENVLFQEEMLWMQKSRCKWLVQGDRNMKFFDTTTMVRRKRNKIEALLNENGDWEYDNDKLMTMVVDYFKGLYREEQEVFSPLHTIVRFPSVDGDAIRNCLSFFKEEEIKDAVFIMNPLKAPGSDGLNALFLQSQWEVIKTPVIYLVGEIFLNPSSIGRIDQTFIVLIPKVQSPSMLKEFRPISLCNITYKIVTRILAST